MSSYTVSQHLLTDPARAGNETCINGSFHRRSTMNLVHPHVSTISPCRTGWVFAMATVASLAAAMEPAWCAETVAGIVSENIAAAQQRRTESLVITPEVSTVRTRVLPAGAMPLTPDGRP